ncbi:hypothetical protein EB796_002149 [Bugula neritina]|uniref:Uncharacterized protein n=1 Tax=Bugula neritina TaxID=10212 RepID=A0A7J7KMZ0_BUGNE|nr:hypothetical protein EB796_002149 [Bugula neritina]
MFDKSISWLCKLLLCNTSGAFWVFSNLLFKRSLKGRCAAHCLAFSLLFPYFMFLCLYKSCSYLFNS